MKNMLILLAIYLAFAIPLSIMDKRKFRISLPVLILGSVCLIVSRFLFPTMATVPLIKSLIYACLSSFLIYFGTRVLSGEGLGWGDVFFGVFSSIFSLFYMNIIATVFASLLGVLYYLFLALLDKFKKNKHITRPIFAIPFVPFITAGTVLSFVLFWIIA